MKTLPPVSASSFARLKPSLALGAVALAASGAQADVIYDNFPDLTAGPDFNPTVSNPSDLDSFLRFDLSLLTITASASAIAGAQIGFRAADTTAFPGKKGPIFSTAPGMYFGQGSNLVSLSLLTAGASMDSSTPTTSSQIPGSNLSNAFVGVKLDAGGGSFNYGWVRFSTGPGSASTITLHDAAFESLANQGITVGAVPEPSSVALLGLAGGAIAWRLRRKRVAA